MRVVTWEDGRVSTRDSIQAGKPMSGAALRDAYADAVRMVTLGLAEMRDNVVVFGPLKLLEFGKPKVTRTSVDWPIEGGLLAGGAGGHWRIQTTGRKVSASVTGYRPRLPRPIYTVIHLPVHQLFTRLYLLQLRGREPALGPPAPPAERFRSATVDAAFCVTLAGLIGRRRPARVLTIGAVYHVACWSVWGRTLGGLVTRQRVVAVDGSRLTPTQSLLRLVLLPASWLSGRRLHDEIAQTDVISD